MRVLILPVLACIACLASPVGRSAEATTDAADLGQAARLLGFLSRFNEGLRVFCGKQFPETKSQFDFLVMSWIDANQAELDALQVYLPTVDRKEFDQKLAGALTKGLGGLEDADTPQEHTAVCEGFAQQLTSSLSMATSTPKASGFLRAYLAEHPLPPLESKKAAARTVCLKKGMNQKIDLDVLRPRCACSTQRMFELLSPKELGELDTVVKAFGDVDALPFVKRIAPQLAECRKK
jgi:hypothetical protein